MGVRIVTDSACDLSREVMEAYNIELMPLVVTHEDETYLDGVSIAPENLFDGMRRGKVYKTAQIPLARLMEGLKGLGRDEAVYIAFSSELSGTYQTACTVMETLKEDDPDLGSRLRIVDSKCASGGMGLVVLKAAQMARAGFGLDEIEAAVRYYAEHMQHIFTVDNLEYLLRGGRVTRAQAVLGSLLNIKPILDVESGRLIPVDKARGHKQLYRRMLELMEERGRGLGEQLVGINHGDDPEAAEKVMAMIRDRFGTTRFLCHSIGCAVGAHSGPGTLAIFFLDEKPPMGWIQPVAQRGV